MNSLASVVTENLPILQVILPMLTAPLCVLLRHRRTTWLLATLVSWTTLGISWLLFQQVRLDGPISYFAGGWPPPWGIELRLEPANALLLLVVSGISSVVLTAAPRSFDAEISHDLHHFVYAAFLLCMTGLLGMASAGDAFNVFVFLEISSLSSYSMIAMGPRRRALTAAFRYLILGTVGGTLILLGIGLLYMSTGTLNLLDLEARLVPIQDSRTVMVALAVIVIGTSIKLALMPFGAWLPDAYTFAPAAVTAFLAATATKVAYYVQARFLFRVFGPEIVFDTWHLDVILLPLALLAMVGGALLAIYAQDVKRLLAYSSLSQIGYLVLGLSLASVSGLTGGLVHLFNHALMKSGLFLVVACVVLRLGSSRVDQFAGLGRRMPWTMAAFVVAGLSMVGVPLTAGFVSKWYLVQGAIADERWWVAAVVLFSSILALVYVWRIVELAYFRPAPAGAEPVAEAPWSLIVPTWILCLATVYFGIFTDTTVGMAQMAAESLLGGGP